MTIGNCGQCGACFFAEGADKDVCPACAPGRSAGNEGERRALRSLRKRGHILFTLFGAFYSLNDLEQLNLAIRKALAEGAQSLAFEFRDSSYLNSTLVNLLIRTIKDLHLGGKPAYLITADANTRDSLQMLGLDRIVRVFPALEVYSKALEEQSGPASGPAA